MVKDSAKKSYLCDEDRTPVPETDTGREVENTKGREITLSKELGKMAPLLRKKGCPPKTWVAVKRSKRLFTKNTGLR